MENKKVWYVTGASKGLGLTLVKELLEQGYRVAATSRCKNALVEAVGSSDDFLPLEVDLGSEASIASSLQAAQTLFGRIDVVVNNAGYGIGGAIEELSNEEIALNFDINVFAPIRVIQKVMPYLRAQRSGHIINISSIAGFAGVTGWAAYAAAKAAVTALSEVMAQDVESLGIKVTAVCPGALKTQFLSSESLVLSGNKIDDYQDVHSSHERYLAMDGKQIGDPKKVAEVLVQLVENPHPPVFLYLGSDAWGRAAAKATHLCDQLDIWKNVSYSTTTAAVPVPQSSFHPSY
ncbi:MAG: SDR family NAD(P)-dependent oxidoreductase [Bacteroidetes bacterium]|nr:SDR family NAD(P)-dependent oxidoreductase [Bacteroidota bacterium]